VSCRGSPRVRRPCATNAASSKPRGNESFSASELVEGLPQLIRLRLPSRLPRRQRDQGQARDVVREGTGPAATDCRLHAAAEGIGPPDLDSAQGVCPCRPHALGAAFEKAGV
jgi:hypothetical protein